MVHKCIYVTEQMGITDSIWPNQQFLPNGRGSKNTVTPKKFMLLLGFVFVNILMTLALIFFVRWNFSNNSAIRIDLEEIKTKNLITLAEANYQKQIELHNIFNKITSNQLTIQRLNNSVTEFQKQFVNELRDIQNAMVSNDSAIQVDLEEMKNLGGKSENQTGRPFRIDQQTENNWNSKDCHAHFMINEKRKSVQRKAIKIAHLLCRAKLMVPRHFGVFYYEVMKHIIESCAIMEVFKSPKPLSEIVIGLAPKEMPLDEAYWRYKGGVYMYESDGTLWGHSVEGSKSWMNKGNSYIEGKPEFDVGDVIGCGMDLLTRQIIYTKNGQRLDTSNLFVDSVDLYPAVSIFAFHDAIEANFGPNFRFNLSKEYGSVF